jgi:spore coat protein U-like protein
MEMHFIMKKFLGLFAGLGLSLSVAALPAAAGTATTNVSVGAVLTNNCTISSPTAVAFGNYTGAVNNVTDASAVEATCTTGDIYTISADTGQNTTHANGTTRAMANGTNYLSYELYKDSGRTTVWNTSNTVGGTGNGVAQDYTIYAQIPGGQTIPIAGTYSDTVIATVSF